MITRINVNDIPPGGLHLELNEPVAGNPPYDALADVAGIEFLSPLKAALSVVRIRNMVELSGDLRTRIATHCSRCLGSMEMDLKASIRLMYARRPGVEARPSLQKEIELTTEDVGLMLFEGDVMDIRQGIYEETLAALPLKPLCHDACRGLCPDCGTDLNRGSCHCGAQAPDPRLAKLLKLKI